MPQALTLDKKIIFLALASAIAVSLIYGIPYFLIKNQLVQEGKIYSPITIFSDGDEAQIYAPLVEDVAGGGVIAGDPALKEHVEDKSILPPLGPLMLGFIGRLAGLERTWVLSDFLFPPIIFLLSFFIIYEFTGMASFSAVFSGIFIFAREIASLFPFSTFAQFKTFAAYFKPYLSAAVENRLPFDRLLAPEWTYIPLGLFFLFRIISLKKQNVVWPIISGVFFGVLFYSYPYDWITVFIILAIYLLLNLLSRDFNRVKLSFLVIVSGLIVSVPYWISFLDISRYPQYQELLNRTGLEVGRTFRYFLLPHYIIWLGLAVWLFWKKKNESLALFSVAIFVASFLVMNIQIFTGYAPQPDHFLRYPLSFALLVAYIIAAREILRQYQFNLARFKPYMIGLGVLALIFVLVRAIELQIAYAKQNTWRYTLEESVDDSFKWIKNNVTRNSVILSPSVITNAHLLIFTPVKVFVPSSGVITAASDKELIERFVIAAKIFGLNDERIKNIFSRNFIEKNSAIGSADDNVAPHLFHYALYRQDPNASFAQKRLREFDDIELYIIGALADWDNNRERMLAKYVFDYIYVGPDEKKYFSFDLGKSDLCFREIFNNKEVSIYERCVR